MKYNLLLLLNSQGGTLPDFTWLDGTCDGNPIYINRHDGHMSLINRAAGAPKP